MLGVDLMVGMGTDVVMLFPVGIGTDAGTLFLVNISPRVAGGI